MPQPWKVLHFLLTPTGAQPLGLTRVFAGVGAAAIGAFSLAMGVWLSSWLEQRMLERDAALSRDFVQSIADIQRVAAFFAKPEGAPSAAVGEFFAHVAAMPDVLRANVYAPDRRVLWSSNAALIGQVFPANEELDEALEGQVVVNAEQGDDHAEKAEHVGLNAAAHRYVENYLPVYEPRSRRMMGVIEVYRRPTALFESIREGQVRIWIGAAGGGLFLFAVLVWFVRRTERAMASQQKRLVEADAMGMVGEISAAVAHSIRNPLGSIRSSAELQRELGQDPQGVHAEVMGHVDRIEHLVRSLLTLAAAPVDSGGQADLGAVLRSAAERFRPQFAADGRSFQCELPSGLGFVAADPVLLAQVVDSLLANAADATGPGQRITLTAGRRGREAWVSVEDTGAGIAPQHLAEVFKPFFTTKPRGLGLGLNLVKRLVERQGGRVELASQLGEGTRVTLQLPLR
ncbi:sensor histidine kinase [Roseateles sp. BYS87W]|uniref:histidine kinase n=1 Tax=Pelomonas baiyunensis TaxID=3299026 RepID=A0ABW7GWH0_9BURK